MIMRLDRRTIEEAARKSGAIDPSLVSGQRQHRLGLELERLGFKAHDFRVHADEERGTLVVTHRCSAGAEWTVTELGASKAPSGSADARTAREIDDGLITGLADVLEAKYRMESTAEHVIRSRSPEGSLVYDTVNLTFRTLRESIALSFRAQRELHQAARRLLPEAEPRSKPLQWATSDPVLQEVSASPFEYSGRFQVRNGRATQLEGALEPAYSYVSVSPTKISLRLDEMIMINVRVSSETALGESFELVWKAQGALLGPVRFVVKSGPVGMQESPSDG